MSLLAVSIPGFQFVVLGLVLKKPFQCDGSRVLASCLELDRGVLLDVAQHGDELLKLPLSDFVGSQNGLHAASVDIAEELLEGLLNFTSPLLGGVELVDYLVVLSESKLNE